jgi:ABC-type transport system involved in multi-copper enzyme maturation permease subunit
MCLYSCLFVSIRGCMRLALKQFLAIAGLTALEAMRQPVVLLLATCCTVFVALLPTVVVFSLGDGQRLVRDSALSLHLVCGLILGGYAACSSLNHEIRRGTAAAVLSKPVGRVLFFLAKYAGVAAVLVLYSITVAAATILATRTAANDYRLDYWSGLPILAAPVLAYLVGCAQNFLFRIPFVSRTTALLVLAVLAAFAFSAAFGPDGARVPFGSTMPWELLPACALNTMAVLLLAGIAVTLATRLDVVPTLSILSLVFVAGLVSDYYFGRESGSAAWVDVVYRLLPNWQHFWVVDALSQSGIPWTYVGRASLYAAFYLAGILCLGIVAFRRTEIEG